MQTSAIRFIRVIRCIVRLLLLFKENVVEKPVHEIADSKEFYVEGGIFHIALRVGELEVEVDIAYPCVKAGEFGIHLPNVATHLFAASEEGGVDQIVLPQLHLVGMTLIGNSESAFISAFVIL